MNEVTNATLMNVLGKNKWYHDKREHNFQINHLNVKLNKKIVPQKNLSPNYFCHKN